MLSYLTGLKIDMNLDLSSQVTEQPLEVALHFPWGGYISGKGYLHFEEDRFRPKKMSFSAQVRDFPLEQLSQYIRMGRLSGQYAVEVDLLKQTLNVEADGKVDEFWIEHRALSQKPVGGKKLAFGGQLNVELGQTEPMGLGVHLTNGFFKLGELVTHLRAEAGSADLSLDTTSIQVALETPEVDAKILNEALPKGLLPDLEPIKAAGQIGLKAGLFIDFANFDATRLEVYVPRKKLRIVRINPALDKKLRSLRSRFTLRHQLTTRDGVVVTQQRNIGPTSSNWVGLEQVPELLPRAMRLQEDGGFFRHKGISEFHIRGSLVSNLKSGRFRRGGSTITMQLARNLFLTKTKTLSRKLQEVILAFMLDGDNVYLTKNEIMTLYLNIVELGPDIYGVKEAAKHYFDKQPLGLTPAEIAWIVRLLPGPRLYYRSFQNGKLTHERIRKINRLLARFVNDDLIMAEQGLPQTRIYGLTAQVGESTIDGFQPGQKMNSSGAVSPIGESEPGPSSRDRWAFELA